MPDPLRRPVLSYGNLRQRADDFLRTYHQTLAIPVPIEEIVEFSFGIDIIPLPGLHRAFDVDGFISSDLRSITVDAFVYEERPGRYRFTLAHELAHAVLHRRIYEEHRFQRAEEWKSFQRDLDEESRTWLEWQAYAWAGLVLVPAGPLRSEYGEAVKMAAQRGVSIRKAGEAARMYVAGWLAERFTVSPMVVEKRLRYDKIWA